MRSTAKVRAAHALPTAARSIKGRKGEAFRHLGGDRTNTGLRCAMRRPLDDLQDAKEQAIPREAPGEGSRRTPGREDGKKGEAPPPRAARLGESEEDIPEVYVACEVRSALPGTPFCYISHLGTPSIRRGEVSSGGGGVRFGTTIAVSRVRRTRLTSTPRARLEG